MDLNAQYCPDRRNLEEKVWIRVSRLSSLTGRLLGLIGKDHQTFTLTHTACSDARADIVDFRQQLHIHRLAHGC
jgi:hypothetical protein